PMRVARLLERLHGALSRTSEGIALVLCDAYARTCIAANELLGDLSLYGLPTTRWLTHAQEKLVRARGGRVGIDAWQTLHLHGNEVLRLAVSESTLAALTRLS